jgi:tubulin-tyrosine ligase family protein
VTITETVSISAGLGAARVGNPCTRAGLARGVAAYLEAVPSAPDAVTEIVVGTPGREVEAATVDALAAHTAPALLILLGDGGEDPIRLNADGEAVVLRAPRLLGAEAGVVVPVVVAFLVTLLREIPRETLPATLLQSQLAAPGDTPGSAVIAQRADEHAVLRAGRLTPCRLSGAHPEPQPTALAQQLLTTLFLYAEPDVRRLCPPGGWTDACRHVSGHARLPIDSIGLREPPALPRVDIPAAPPSSVAGRPVIAVLELTITNRPWMEWVARSMSHNQAAEILLVPWFHTSIEDDGARVFGPMTRFVDGTSERIEVDEPRRADVLFYQGTSGTGDPAPGEEMEFLDSLAKRGMARKGVTRGAAINAMLRSASLRGVTTNGSIPDGVWSMKDYMELLLRAYERNGGRSIVRPEAHSATIEQVPTLLRYFARHGATCIVKAAGSDNGKNLRVMRPDAFPSWSPSAPERPYIVQSMVRDPISLGGFKSDLRCHLLVDVEDRQRSRLVSPILMRRAGVPYARGDEDAEITNINYQHRAALPADIRPIENWEILPDDVRAEIVDGVRKVADAFLDAHAWWTRTMAPRDRWTPRRVIFWGLDILPGRLPDGSLEMYLLEANGYAQLFRKSSTLCNDAVARTLSEEWVPALLERAGAGATTVPSLAFG